jgi:hypothetical protein
MERWKEKARYRWWHKSLAEIDIDVEISMWGSLSSAPAKRFFVEPMPNIYPKTTIPRLIGD